MSYSVYVWEEACNYDYTGGDAVVVARTLAEAKVKVLKPDNQGRAVWDSCVPVRDPDHTFPLSAAGVCWYGPGGG